MKTSKAAPKRQPTGEARGSASDQNVAGDRADARSIDGQLRFAIANKYLIQFRYHGRHRVAEPHDYGIQKGTAKLLVYQLRASVGGDAPSGSTAGWRLLDVEKILECSTLEEKFPGSRGDAHHRHHTWDVLCVRVT